MSVRPALGLLAGLALTGCLGENIPTKAIGGTQYNMNLTVPAAVRLPQMAVQTHGTAALVDSLTLTLQALKSVVAPARYQLWIVDTLGGAWPVRADVRLIRTDTVVGSTGAITTVPDTTQLGTQGFYAGAPDNTIARLRVRRSAADSIPGGAAWVLLTIQADSAASSLTDATPRPLWFRFRPTATTVASGNAQFGTFDRPVPRLWTAQGTGRSAFWDRNRDGRLIFAGLAFSLTQPPVGYYYQPWAVDPRTGLASSFGLLRDTATDQSLFDADLRPSTGSLSQLPPARFTTTEDSIDARFVEYGFVNLVLEPKLGDRSFPASTIALQGTLPDTLAARRPLGVVLATVTKGGTPASDANIVVYATDTPIVLGSRVTDASGIATIDKLPTARVDVRIFPPAGSTATEDIKSNLQVTSGDTLRVTFTLQ